MTDLTEQLKKGELPDGEYWCLSVCGDVDKLYCYQNSFWKYKTEDDYYGIPVEIKQVLAPVPTFDEWEQLQHWADFTNDYHELREKLEIAEYEKVELLEKVKQLKSEYEKECHRADELEDSYWKEVEKNKKLKELLKECRPYISRSATSRMIKNSAGYKKDMKLLTKIDEVKK